MSNIIYLYVKTHNKTGLKYLGKTSKPDVHKYKGSGSRWLKHIKKHGYDVTTEILFETIDTNELRIIGEFFSDLFNIVESKIWANLCKETGEGTGCIGDKNGMFGKTHNKNTKEKLSKLAKQRFKNKTYEEIYGLEKSIILKKIRSEHFKRKNNKGQNNPRFDFNQYKFTNLETKEVFEGTRFDFCQTFQLPKSSVHYLIVGKVKNVHNWVVHNQS